MLSSIQIQAFIQILLLCTSIVLLYKAGVFFVFLFHHTEYKKDTLQRLRFKKIKNFFCFIKDIFKWNCLSSFTKSGWYSGLWYKKKKVEERHYLGLCSDYSRFTPCCRENVNVLSPAGNVLVWLRNSFAFTTPWKNLSNPQGPQTTLWEWVGLMIVEIQTL